jgi:tetratricopeptide (TPR) repeat protein
VLGRSLVSQIFHGIHIHGPTSTFLSHYRGALEVKEAGEYRFAAMSESPSYLLINGRLVSQCAGWGALEAARRGDNAVKLKLNAGRHQLEYFHAQVGGTFIASVMWQTPGMKRPEILPASAFAPVAEFQTAAYESARLPLYAEWNVVAHNIHGGLAVVDMSFTARAAGQPVNEAVWKFDDGSSEKGTTVRHTFPRAGMRTVTLELGGKSLTFKVNVRPQWSREKDWSESLFGKQCADLLKRDFALMPLDDLLSLTRLARSVDHLELLSKCGLACLERHTEITGADVHVLRALADHFQNHRVREYATAEKCLRAALQSKSLDSATADRMRLSLADFLVQVTGQTTEALDLLKQIKTASLSGDDRRWHSLTEADARVALGQVDTARKLYELAAPGDDPRSVRQSVRRSVQLANADLYIQRGEFEVAEKIVADIWWNVPVERMSTAPGRMMLRVYKGRREFPRALTLCQRLLNVATLDNDRSELMLELIEILMTLKQDKDATEVLARLVADFPYSESAAIAKDRWAGKLALPAPKK